MFEACKWRVIGISWSVVECIGASFEAQLLMRIGRTRVSFKKKPTTLIQAWSAYLVGIHTSRMWLLNMVIGNWRAPSGKLFLCKRVCHNLREAKLLCKNNEILKLHQNSQSMLWYLHCLIYRPILCATLYYHKVDFYVRVMHILHENYIIHHEV